jgi:hypothetical protein
VDPASDVDADADMRFHRQFSSLRMIEPPTSEFVGAVGAVGGVVGGLMPPLIDGIRLDRLSPGTFEQEFQGRS